MRAMWLAPSCYPLVPNFFHFSAWTTRGLLERSWEFLAKEDSVFWVGEQAALLGDHTKVVTRTALSNIIRTNLFSFGKDWITRLVLPKQNNAENTGQNADAA